MDDPGVDPGEGGGLSFRTRLTVALVGTAVVPLSVFGLVAYLTDAFDPTVGRLLLFALVVTILIAILFSYLVATDLTRPLRAIASAVDRVSAGDLSTPIQVPGDDELARLAESHNRLAADLDRRDREVAEINAAISDVSVRDGVAFLVARGAAEAKRIFNLPEARLLLGDPDDFPVEEVVPGEMRPLRAVLRAGDESIGLLLGRLPPLRPWARADQDLLELFASEIAVAIRNAELYERVEAQNAQLLELDAAKDDFLRGVSHNLQTPLTSIRAHADQLKRDRAGSPAGGHRGAGRPAVTDGPPAPHGDAARVGCPASASRGRQPCCPHPPRVGSARSRGAIPARRRCRGLARDRRRRPARPGAVGPPRQRRQVRARHADRRGDRPRPRHEPAAPDDRSTTDRASRSRIASGSSAASSGATKPRRTRAAASGCSCRASCAARWAATSSSSRPTTRRGAAFSVYLPAELAEEG